MFNFLVTQSLKNRLFVLAIAAILVLYGGFTVTKLPVDVFPDLTAPTVTILTEGRGMAPEEMESLVTLPIESAINGASGVRRVRSATAIGIAVAVIALVFFNYFQARLARANIEVRLMLEEFLEGLSEVAPEADLARVGVAPGEGGEGDEHSDDKGDD